MSQFSTSNPFESGGDPRVLWVKQLAATYTEVFHTENIFEAGGYFLTRDLQPGQKSADFTIFGESPDSAEEYARGALRDGKTLPSTTVNVTLDDPIEFPYQIDLRDDEISKWSLVEPHVREASRKVAEKIDNRAIITLLKAARTSANGVIGAGHTITKSGSGLTVATQYPVTANGALALVDDFAEMAQKFDDAKVPRAGRKVIIENYLWRVLTRAERVVNMDYRGGQGNVANRTVGTVEGWEIILTPDRMPSTNVTDSLSKYSADFSIDGAVGRPVAAFMWKDEMKGPIGMVRVPHLSFHDDFIHQNSVRFLNARRFVGMGVVYPFCAGELRVLDNS